MGNRVSFRSTFLFLCSLVLLTACGHVEETRSARQQQATEFNQRAQRAFQRGEYQAAAALYENALQLDAAVENVNGIAINMLNLAKVNQVLGNTALAQRYLDSLLQDKALHYAPAASGRCGSAKIIAASAGERSPPVQRHGWTRLQPGAQRNARSPA